MSVIFTIALGVAGSVIAAELLGVCPLITNWLIMRAARRMPRDHSERYLAEWQAEIDYMRLRCGNLSILLWAVAVYITSIRLASELRGASETPAWRSLYRMPLFDVTPRPRRQYRFDFRTLAGRLRKKARRRAAPKDPQRLRRTAIRFFDAAALILEDPTGRIRRNAIKRIVASRGNVSRDTIVRRLRERGYTIDQETLAAELHALGAVNDGDGYYFPRNSPRKSNEPDGGREE
jgi:hypothetical protein